MAIYKVWKVTQEDGKKTANVNVSKSDSRDGKLQTSFASQYVVARGQEIIDQLKSLEGENVIMEIVPENVYYEGEEKKYMKNTRLVVSNYAGVKKYEPKKDGEKAEPAKKAPAKKEAPAEDISVDEDPFAGFVE